MIYLALLIITLAFTIVFFQLYTGVPPYPSSRGEVKAAMDLLSPYVQPKFKVYELGAGWGNLVFPLAKRFPACQFVAIEISPLPYAYCLFRSIFHPNVKVFWGDFFCWDLSGADVVLAYLMRPPMFRLEEKLDGELRKGALVAAVAFHFHRRVPFKKTEEKGASTLAVALYRWPPEYRDLSGLKRPIR